jgi:hypothetical protein
VESKWYSFSDLLRDARSALHYPVHFLSLWPAHPKGLTPLQLILSSLAISNRRLRKLQATTAAQENKHSDYSAYNTYMSSTTAEVQVISG